MKSASYCRFEPYHLRASSRSSGSLVFRFAFLLDFLLVVPNIERNFGKNGLTATRTVLDSPKSLRRQSMGSAFGGRDLLIEIRAPGLFTAIFLKGL